MVPIGNKGTSSMESLQGSFECKGKQVECVASAKLESYALKRCIVFGLCIQKKQINQGNNSIFSIC